MVAAEERWWRRHFFRILSMCSIVINFHRFWSFFLHTSKKKRLKLFALILREFSEFIPWLVEGRRTQNAGK